MNTAVKDVMTTWVISGILHRRDQARARGITAGDRYDVLANLAMD